MHVYQCDQMARLFVNICTLVSMNIGYFGKASSGFAKY